MNPALISALLHAKVIWDKLKPEQKKTIVKVLRTPNPFEKAKAARDLDLDAVLTLSELMGEPLGFVPDDVPGERYAALIPMAMIRTDPKRFQNRTDAFSEASAESVEKFYDQNKFDPIVVWQDPTDGLIYVLSGHSRFEGLKRRGEQMAPARFFRGDEEAAIVFARVDANRAASSENLLEDLKAYVLMRDGNPERGIKPATKADLRRSFKGKHSKLEPWSHLDPAGKFLAAMQAENAAEFPYLQRFAAWVGNLRSEKGEDFTNIHEKDVFNWLYSDRKNSQISSEDFDALIRKRLSYGKERLFPECNDDGSCTRIKDFAEVGPHKDLYKDIEKLDAQVKRFQDRLATNDPVLKVYTQEEKEVLRRIALESQEQLKKMKKDLKIVEAEPGFFGLGCSDDPSVALADFVVRALSDKKFSEEIEVGEVESDPDGAVENLLDVSPVGFRLVIHADDVRHVFNRHGATGKKGERAVTLADLANVAAVVNSPDTVKKRKTPRETTLRFEKRVGDLTVVVQTVSKSRRIFRLKTLWVNT